MSRAVKDTVLLTIPETARQLRCGDSTVYRMIARGDLPSVDIAGPGSQSKTRVLREDLTAYLRKARRARKSTATP